MEDVLAAVFRTEWHVLLLLGVLLVLVAEIGFRLGMRLHRSRDVARKEQIGGLQAAVLGLLGLLLGFTFAMAVGRYDARRALVVQEANAIGTTYLRASLLPEEERGPVEELLRRYVALRARVLPFEAGSASLREAVAASAELQRQLWRQAQSAARRAPTAIVASFIAALNETFDTEAERVAAARNRIPGVVWLLLLMVAALGCLMSAYAAGAEGARSAFSSVVLPLLISVAVTLIFDLANPTKGFIGVSQQPLLDLKESISAGAAGSP